MKAEEEEAAPSCREQRGGRGSPLLCAGCGSGIWDRFLLRLEERPWHERCLRCCECAQPLRGRCFCRQRRLYCTLHYHKLFPARCSSCGGALGCGEPVLRLLQRLFHPRCLRCSCCRRELRSGERFLLREGRILCSTHWDTKKTAPSSCIEDPKNSQNSPKNSQNSPGKDPKGPKRPRTVLSSQQRRAFRDSFQLSPKPCRKVREALAAQTGLTLRVVQVWFQNQRAKMKKLARRQQQLEHPRGGNETGEASQGFFGAALGPSGEENPQELLGNPKIPKIPQIPEPGIPKIPQFPGISQPGIAKISGISGIPEPGIAKISGTAKISGIPEPGIAKILGISGISEPGIPKIPQFSGIPEPGIPNFPQIPGIPELGIPKIPGIPEPGIPKFPQISGNPESGIAKIPQISGIPEPGNVGILGIPAGNPIDHLYSMQSFYFTS